MFVYDFEGPCVAHGARADFVGRTLQGILDYVGNTAVNGTELHEQFVANANRGGGWVPYPWKNNDGTPDPKIAYLIKIKKFGKEYYAGVGYKPSQFPLGECSGLYDSSCAEANVASIVGQVSAEIQSALDDTALAALLSNVTAQSGDYLMNGVHASSFHTWVLSGEGSEMELEAFSDSDASVSDASEWVEDRLKLESVVGLSAYLGIVSTPGSSVVKEIEASSSTGMRWFIVGSA